MLTRRCVGRQLLLRPDNVTNASFLYCLAVAAEKFGVFVHAILVMSNHYHLIITDVLGNYPEFLGYLNSLLARCLNCHRHRCESFWASEQPSVVHLADANAVLDKTGYTLTNPVAAHLVQDAIQWPGVSSLAAQLGDGRMRAKRPRHFFSDDGGMPEEVELQLPRPPQFDHLSDASWVALLESEIKRREQAAMSERTKIGRKVMGRQKVLRQDPFSFPPSTAPRGGVIPRVATKNRWLRVERLQQNKTFQRLYRAAYEAWSAGIDAIFPQGTYKLSLLARVVCDPAPDPAC